MQKKNYSIVVVIMCFTFGAWSQQNDNSPYSRYGIGLLTDKNFNHLRQMGGLGASFIDAHQINIVNPASYSFLSATAFEVGFFAKHTVLTDQTNTNKFWTGNLEYLSLGFPLKNPINEIYDGKILKQKFGMNVTLMANSNVDYNIQVKDSLEGIGKFDRNYLGTGGTYKFMWGNAYKYNDFSVGLNLGYLFGKIKTERNLIYDPAKYAYNSFNSSSYNISGFTYNAGVLYTKNLNEKKVQKNKSISSRRIIIGAHFKGPDNFSTNSNISNNLVQQLPGGILNVDTLLFAKDKEGKGSLPAEFGAGLTYYIGEKSAIGVNYTSSAWSNYYNEATNEVVGSLENSSKYSLGGYFRPNYKSIDNLLERMYYRYGAYYGTDALAIDGEPIKTYGLTLGFGLPVVYQRKISHINLGANFGTRGIGTTIEERFVKVTMSVTFNDDEWFLKRKYN